MDANDFEPKGPNLEEIQCTRCKHIPTFEWEGETVKCPGLGSCLKYPKEKGGKPNGIIFKIVNTKEHQNYEDGHYIKCPFFEEN